MGSRILNVKMFPGLFKRHKSYDLLKSGKNKRWVTREFILFLDRRVENEIRILISFYIIAMTICSLALSAFFRFIPVHASETELCLRTDDRSRTHYCYTHESAAYSLPVDCDAYNSTEPKGITLSCYTISVLDVGIALAAALALAKVARTCITIFILMNEWLYKRSQDKTIECRPNCRLFYLFSCILFQYVIPISLLVLGFIIYLRTITAENHQAKRAAIGYALLPTALFPSLCTIICTLSKHCDQEEYISHCQQQLPHCKKCCDVPKDKKSVSAGDSEIRCGESHNEGGAATSETDRGAAANRWGCCCCIPNEGSADTSENLELSIRIYGEAVESGAATSEMDGGDGTTSVMNGGVGASSEMNGGGGATSDTVGGGAATGETVEGGAATGETVGGGATTGEIVGGGAATGETVGGGAATGETVGGGATTGEIVGSGAATGETVGGGAATGETVGGGATTGETVGGGAATGETVGGGATTGEIVGGGAATGEIVGGGAATGETVGGGATTGDHETENLELYICK